MTGVDKKRDLFFYLSKEEIGKLPYHANNYIRSLLAAPFMKICNMLFFKKKKIVFDNFAGAGYGGNPRCIANYLLKQADKYELVWIVKDVNRSSIPSSIRAVKKDSWKELYELATAKMWIDDCRKISHIIKQQNQFYIQTWHANGPALKTIEKDAQQQLTQEYIRCAINDSKMADLFISGCRWTNNNYRQAFWYDGDIMNSGIPTADVLFEDRNFILNSVREHFNIDTTYRVALYAPTFRNDHSIDCYDLDYYRAIESLSNTLGGEWCIILRLHPAISGLCRDIHYNNRVINGTDYPIFEELLVASDVLITDFSNCMFDGFRLKKPVFLYASDYYDYLDNERRLYFEIDDLPAPFAMTNDELEQNIKSFDSAKYKNNVDSFVQSLGYYPLHNATKTIVDLIKTKLN